jgi:hypothetical protein
MTHSKRKREDSPILLKAPQIKHSNRDYKHSRLPTLTSIRILELEPGSGTTTLRCKLSVVERGHAQPYEAISYSWGRSENTRVIYCDGKKLRVTLNLRDALWRIRDPTHVKILWADAVCINQNDNEERANQVKEMGRIYADAVRVLVWLDVPNAKFGDFDYLFDLDIKNPTKAVVGRTSQLLEDYVSKLETAALDAEGLDPDSNTVAHAFSHLLDSPWFTRLWVVQEVGLAKLVVAMFGDISIDFVDLIRFILRIECRTLLIDKLGFVTAAKAYIFTTFPARSIELAGEIEEDWDFLELMEVTRSQQASDHRDYVYALLGHPCALIEGVPIMVPNYNRKPHDLFFELTTKLIQSTNSLRVLSAVQHNEDSLLAKGNTSWISTWNRDIVVTSLGVSREWYYDVSYDTSAGMAPKWELEKPTKTLKVNGFIVDSIVDIISTQEDDEDGELVSKPIDQVITETFTLPCRASLPALDNLLEIGHTITVGYSNDKPEHFFRAFAAFRLHLIKEAYNQGRYIPIDLSPESNSQMRETAAGEDIDGIYWSVSRFCTGRKVFSTKTGRLGLGPSVLKEGDICCVLFGAPVPFILRRVNSSFKIVGEAYIHGIMKGEAVVDWILGEQYQEKTFEIQ